MRVLRALFALTLLSLIGITPALAQSGGKTASAKIVDFNFEPGRLEVDAGTTVTWTNAGGRPHTVTDRGGTFDTNPIAPGAKGSTTFTVPGTYNYFCRINPSKMNGVMVVKGDENARATRVQALDPAREGEALRFDPVAITVKAGATLLFANVGGKPHTLTADDGSFDTGVVTPGAEGGRFAGTNASVVLNKAGVFPFHCEVHPAAMKGTITVEAGDGAPPPAAASSAPREVTVEMGDLFFKPPQVSVAPGGTINFVNKGQAPHDAKFDDVPGQTATLKNGGKASLTAPGKPGSYSYLCTIHAAKMRAVIVVLGQNAAAPAVQAAAGGGPGGGISTFVLVTAIVASFLGGAGITAFLRRSSES
jgi:plastocyanin